MLPPLSDPMFDSIDGDWLAIDLTRLEAVEVIFWCVTCTLVGRGRSGKFNIAAQHLSAILVKTVCTSSVGAREDLGIAERVGRCLRLSNTS